MIDENQLFITMDEEKIIKTCAFTGHRNLTDDFNAEELYESIETVIEGGADTFYNGMAQGFDLIAAECVLHLKKKYPYIRLIACIPCLGQEKNFSAVDKERYVQILKRSDEQVILSEYYFKGCMQVRDRYMADRADILVAFCKKEKGGTAFTVQYFQKKYPRKQILFL